MKSDSALPVARTVRTTWPHNKQDLPVTNAEKTIELTYLIPVNSGLALQPDLQYVVNPNTRRRYRTRGRPAAHRVVVLNCREARSTTWPLERCRVGPRPRLPAARMGPRLQEPTAPHTSSGTRTGTRAGSRSDDRQTCAENRAALPRFPIHRAEKGYSTNQGRSGTAACAEWCIRRRIHACLVMRLAHSSRLRRALTGLGS